MHREQYYYGVPGSELTAERLTEVLDRFPPERPGIQTVEETAEAQARLQVARIAALTDMLRDADPNEIARLASRMLLSDLAAVAARFRGRANAMRSSLAQALAEMPDVCDDSADSERR
jgi:hypothetical protein